MEQAQLKRIIIIHYLVISGLLQVFFADIFQTHALNQGVLKVLDHWFVSIDTRIGSFQRHRGGENMVSIKFSCVVKVQYHN